MGGCRRETRSKPPILHLPTPRQSGFGETQACTLTAAVKQDPNPNPNPNHPNPNPSPNPNPNFNPDYNPNPNPNPDPDQVSGPRAAVKHAGAIAAAYASLWGCEAVCEGLPTTILRPPKSSPLSAHIDSGSLLELYVGCRQMLRARTPTAQAWAARHGCQSLVHWAGPPPAPQKQDACTYGLAGLTVARYFAYLSLFHPDHLHGADTAASSAAAPSASATRQAPFAPPKTCDPRAKAAAADPHGLHVDCAAERLALLPRASEPAVARYLAKGGPVFCPFFDKAALEALNQVLAALEPGDTRRPPPPGGPTATWLARLEACGKLGELRELLQLAPRPPGPVLVAPMVPVGPDAARYPVCITWLRGFPHMANAGGLRLTFVPHLLPRPPATAAGLAAMERIEAERRRTVRRAQLMQRGEYAAIRADAELRKPLAGGGGHSHPEQEEQMHRDYDRRAYASSEELEAYDALTRRLNEHAVAAMRAELGSEADPASGK